MREARVGLDDRGATDRGGQRVELLGAERPHEPDRPVELDVVVGAAVAARAGRRPADPPREPPHAAALAASLAEPRDEAEEDRAARRQARGGGERALAD